jgi:hypothetical protein
VLGRIDPDRDDHLVEQRRGALNDVEVPVGDRVEGPGADGTTHDISSRLGYDVGAA